MTQPTAPPQDITAIASRPSSRLRWDLLGLAVIVALAAALRFANLDELGAANHYYRAAVATMPRSWHNFFFVAAQAGGSVSVDKPPVGLWLQAISAHFVGVNALGVRLPQVLAGILCLVLVFHLVRRTFGGAAGLLAAPILGVTPIAVPTDRNNTMSPASSTNTTCPCSHRPWRAWRSLRLACGAHPVASGLVERTWGSALMVLQ